MRLASSGYGGVLPEIFRGAETVLSNATSAPSNGIHCGEGEGTGGSSATDTRPRRALTSTVSPAAPSMRCRNGAKPFLSTRTSWRPGATIAAAIV